VVVTMSGLPFTLAGERKTCPICERPNVRLVTSGLEIVREYRCGDCGARWAVEGRQDSLALDLDGEVMSLPFE
jgi:ribosomal protein L37AE/L43A